MPRGVIGNTLGSGPRDSWFEPRRGNWKGMGRWVSEREVRPSAPALLGRVAERSKAHAWRACGPQKRLVGSNPTPVREGAVGGRRRCPLAPRRAEAARSSLLWNSGAISPISSRKTVPRPATANWPRRSEVAPVNAPRRCPNSSDSRSVEGSAVQSTAINGSAANCGASWIARAMSSLPVPLPPGRPRWRGSRPLGTEWDR